MQKQTKGDERLPFAVRLPRSLVELLREKAKTEGYLLERYVEKVLRQGLEAQ